MPDIEKEKKVNITKDNKDKYKKQEISNADINCRGHKDISRPNDGD